MCKETIQPLLKYKEQAEEKPGKRLAQLLTNAGIRITPQEFVVMYTNLKSTPQDPPRMSRKEELKKKCKEACNKEIELEVPPNTTWGDYALQCAKLHESPQEVLKKIKIPSWVEKTQIQGPYLNFFITTQALAEEALTEQEKLQEHQKIMLEFPSPNTNKPLHLGHIRNIVTGQALANLKKAQGNTVYIVNLLNDRGVHICKSLLAYQKWGNNKEPNKKKDHFVGDFYVLFAKEVQSNPGLEQEAQEMLQKWENNDKGIRMLWQKMNEWAQEGFKETFKKFDLTFDKVYKESEIYQEGTKIIKEAAKKGIFSIDATGAVIAMLEPELPNKILLRSDGTAIYMTQDIALARQKYQDFTIDRSIVLTGTEQNLHFKQLAKILQLLKEPFVSEHVNYGMVYLPEGKMKSREGTVIDADDFLEELTQMAKKEIQKRHGEPDDLKERAESIALAAIRCYMLKIETHKDIHYDPKESLAFEGETGPYLQYTHARAGAILRKEEPKGTIAYATLNDTRERRIFHLLLQRNEILQKAAEHNKPAIVVRYTLDLAQAFNEWYHACPVLEAPTPQLKNARLALTQKVKQTIKQMLDMLAIKAPEVM